MTFPPPLLPVDYSNATPSQNFHPDAHNELNAAINDIVGEVVNLESTLIQSGAVTNEQTDGDGAIDVTFPTPYTGDPTVVAMRVANTPNPRSLQLDALPTATGFRVRLHAGGNIQTNTTGSFNWISIGPR